MAYLCAFAVAGRSLERANAAACAPGEAEGAEKEGRLRGSQTLPWLVAALLAEDRNIIINPP